MASNYDGTAAAHSAGLCSYAVAGCTHSTADNYVSAATSDDGSCNYLVPGCMDSSASILNYDSLATKNTGCRTRIEGCMDRSASNYNEFATVEATPSDCAYAVLGCTVPASLNYDPSATQDDESCVPIVNGCMDSVAATFSLAANTDDGSCFYAVPGCTSSFALNYDTLATINSADACRFPSETNGYRGCTDSAYQEYSNFATQDDGSCVTKLIVGCMDPTAANYDADATVYDNSCISKPLEGCMNPTDTEYDPQAVKDTEPTSSCSGQIRGCTDSESLCYNSLAVADDGSCQTTNCVGTFGCQDSLATNYNPDATKQRSSSDCTFPPKTGCNLQTASNYDSLAVGCGASNPTCCTGFTRGCTDSRFANYQSAADNDDGSCYRQGCTIKYADNYDALATDPTGLAATAPSVCTLPVVGCMDPSAQNYNSNAEFGQGCTNGCNAQDAPNFPQCEYPGCTDSAYPNYDPSATVIASGTLGGCDLPAPGCTYSQAPNFNPTANINDGSCDLSGCMIPGAANYKDWAETPAACDLSRSGCTDSRAVNYAPLAEINFELSSCSAEMLGTMNQPAACLNLQCVFGGCTESKYFSYDPSATVHVSTDCVVINFGCNQETAYNYAQSANTDDGSCIYGGCTDSTREYYDPSDNLQLYNVTHPVYHPHDCPAAAGGTCRCCEAWEVANQSSGPTTPFGSNVEGCCTTHDVANACCQAALDDQYYHCGGLLVPPPSPPPRGINNWILVFFFTAEGCLSFSERVFGWPNWAGAWAFGMVGILGPRFGGFNLGSIPGLRIPMCSFPSQGDFGRRLSAENETELRRLGEAENSVVVDVDLVSPEGTTPTEMTSEMRTVPLDDWSNAFGVTVTGLLLCERDANGQAFCDYPPPSAPPVIAPFSPPPAEDGVPVIVIVIVVVTVLLLGALLVIGLVILRRRKKRVESSAVTPEVADRAVVQPPPLPSATYNDRVPVNPPTTVDTE